MTSSIADWLIAYTIHSTLLLGGIFLLERARLLVEIDVRELAWRAGLLAPLATAALQVALVHGAMDTTAPRHEPAVIAAPSAARDAPAEVVVAAAPAAPAAVPDEPVTRTFSIPLTFSREPLVIVWLTIAALGAGLLSIQFLLMQLAFRRAPPCTHSDWHADVDAIARRAGVNVAHVRELSDAV